MVSSFSNPGFPHVHAHPTRFPTMDASLSVGIDSFDASMRSMRAAFREAINSALAPIRHELSLLRRDLALAAEGVSDPAPTSSDDTESIDLGHPGLQGDDNPPRIPSPIEVHSVPPLLSSSPLLQALATSAIRPQSTASSAARVPKMATVVQLLPVGNESVFKPHATDPVATTVTIPLLDLEKAMPVAASVQSLGVPLRNAKATESTGLSQLADQETNTNTTKHRHEVLRSLIYNLSIGKAKWHWLLLFILAYYLGVILVMYDVLLTEINGWVNWYLVGEIVKKNFYALHLFDDMSKRHNTKNMSLSSNLEALDIVVLVCRSLTKDLAASFTEENGTLGHINAFKQFLCLSLLHSCALTVMAISQLDYSIFTSLLSKLNQELCNRVDVHFDAVFFVNCVANDHIFQQPGWCHTFTNPCDNISYQRVVFN
ncbi:hypothetical protein ACFX2B_040935 [Malus domestica]